MQVDICILDTILMLPEFGPESGALATVGEFVLCVIMRDVIYILNDAMDCKNNNNELTASGS